MICGGSRVKDLAELSAVIVEFIFVLLWKV